MTAKEIITKLIEEKNYDRVQTERLEGKIEALSEDIRTALESWLETGSLESPEYSGYTVEKILEKRSYKEVAAFLMLDWIRRDPDNAIKSLNRPFIRRV